MKYVSQISSIIVALLFVYTINFKSFVTISYFVNQTEIIELFCINKEKPTLQCNGKCHLATQLAEVEKDTKDAPFSQESMTHHFEINPVLVQAQTGIKQRETEHKKKKYILKNTIPCDGFLSITSPPPKA